MKRDFKAILYISSIFGAIPILPWAGVVFLMYCLEDFKWENKLTKLLYAGMLLSVGIFTVVFLSVIITYFFGTKESRQKFISKIFK